MSTSEHHRTCPLCEAACGLSITTEGDQVVRIRGDVDDPFSKGFICPKGSALKHLHEDPDRLTVPLIREGDGFREASWEEAFEAVAEGIGGVVERHGRGALASYFGNPSVHNTSILYYSGFAVRGLGTTTAFSASTADQIPKQLSSGYMYGTTLSIPIPDVDRSQYVIVMGANPSASNGSLLTAPGLQKRLDAIIEREGKVVVIDPRRTKSAEKASEHHFIQPGTDALLLAAMAQTLFSDGRADLGAIAEHCIDLETVAAAVERFTPEAVTARVGIAADEIRRIAHELADAESGVVYGRIGTCTQEFGTTTSWLADIVTAITGNLDQPGGAMWPKPVTGAANTKGHRSGGKPVRSGRWKTRVRGAEEVMGQLPCAAMAEEISTPGEGQIRGLLTVAGNPARSVPDSEGLETALDDLEFMVSVDLFLNETTRHANVILPGESHLQSPHYTASFYALAVRHAAKWGAEVFSPDDDRPREWEIMIRLGALFSDGYDPSFDTESADDLAFLARVSKDAADQYSNIFGRDVEELLAMACAVRGPERIVDHLIRIGPYGDAYGTNPDGWNLARLKDNKNGIDLGPMEPRIPEMLRTPSGMVELAPESLIADLDRLGAHLSAPPAEMVLIGRRNLRTNNSWMHNVENLLKGSTRCTMIIHPNDASVNGLIEGADATITSAAGSVTAMVEISDEVMPGVVSLPHGWGHDDVKARLNTAATKPGVNSNVLTDPAVLDPLSGNAVLNGIPVSLTPA